MLLKNKKNRSYNLLLPYIILFHVLFFSTLYYVLTPPFPLAFRFANLRQYPRLDTITGWSYSEMPSDSIENGFYYSPINLFSLIFNARIFYFIHFGVLVLWCICFIVSMSLLLSLVSIGGSLFCFLYY